MAKSSKTVSDSMGEMSIPADALYGAQTQRAIENFPLSGLQMPRPFIRALGLIKVSAAEANAELGLMPKNRARAIGKAGLAVARGDHDDQFPVDIFQTGSGTSSNMNCNEVIASLATATMKQSVGANDDVNMGQSSNDVIPSAIHLSASLQLEEQLLPALAHLHSTIRHKAKALRGEVKTGRTHLMDAMPIDMAQELSGWAAQVNSAIQRIKDTQKRLLLLAQGGTAVGTGINAHAEFGKLFATRLGTHTGLAFKASPNYFEAISSQDTAVELSGQLKTLATSLLKISNDLRWMNSGPLAGFAEIELQALQPGSSIMPGKVNPVIPEAVAMVAVQVTGNDATITAAGQSGNFQLNVMLPLIAYNLLQSIEILANGCRLLADKAIASFSVNKDKLQASLAGNPILVTALNPIIGYDKAAAIAKQAYAEGRAIFDVALEQTDIDETSLKKLLNPRALTRGGIRE